MKIHLIFENSTIINYVQKIKNYIYIHIYNTLCSYKYKGNLIFENSKEQDILTTINYLSNLYIKEELPSFNNIILTIIENKNIETRRSTFERFNILDKPSFFDFKSIFIINKKMFYFLLYKIILNYLNLYKIFK